MIRSNLATVLKDKNMTTQEVHEKSGISRNTLRLMIKNESKGVQFETLNKLVEVLNCSVEDIVNYVPDSISFSFFNQDVNTYLKYKTESFDVIKQIQYEINDNHVFISNLIDGEYLIKQLTKIHKRMMDIFCYLLVSHLIEHEKLSRDVTTVIVIHEMLTHEIPSIPNISTVVNVTGGKPDESALSHFFEIVYLDGKDKEVQMEDGKVNITFEWSDQ